MSEPDMTLLQEIEITLQGRRCLGMGYVPTVVPVIRPGFSGGLLSREDETYGSRIEAVLG